VIAKITGSLLISARDDSGWESASDERAGGEAPGHAECGMRNAEFQGQVDARGDISAASLIDLA
jgi:hypothetical protein